MQIRALVAAFGLATLATTLTPAHAQAVRSERALTLDAAVKVASAAVAECQAKGYFVTATVVDRQGVVRATLRHDNATASTLGSAQAKAYTSAGMRANSGAVMENAQKNPGAANLGQIPGIILLAGGVPIRAGNEVIGAVGVGGAPGGHLDEQCASAGVDSVKEQLR